MTERKEKTTKQKKPIILIVDDVPRNIQLLGTLLSKFDCELAVAMNGQQALKTVSRVKPDLILLDIMMPEMDGHEVCQRLKQQEETRNIPVIFLSAKSETEDIIKGFELGAVDYITKPFIGSELLARVKTHLSLKQIKEDLEEEVATKNKFFSIISHDLRGSFGIILSFVQLLQENRDDLSVEETNEMLEDIGSTTRNTLDLLENLLEWARSQTGGINFKPQELHLNNVVPEILKVTRDIASKKDIRLSVNTNSEKVFADKNMLLLIIRNLVSNAMKFTPPGGRVTLESQTMEDNVKISVMDSGIGIEPEKIEQLFKIDNKVSTPGTENEEGNGLGLILCHEFVKRNHGEIGIESERGKGTNVWFTLPRKGVEEDTA